MNRIILLLFALGLCFALVHTLKCYSCAGAFNEKCEKKQCAAGEQCYNGKGATDQQKVLRGCVEAAQCPAGTVVVGTDAAAVTYKVAKCCTTDLCNSAPGLPGGSGLKLALASAAALFVAQVLV